MRHAGGSGDPMAVAHDIDALWEGDAAHHYLLEPPAGAASARWSAARVRDFQSSQGSRVRALPPREDGVVSVPMDDADPELTEKLLAALHRDGVVVLTRAVDMDQVNRLKAELRPHVDARPTAKSVQLGAHTKRLRAIVARAGEAAYPFVAHPALVALCEAVLGRQALHLDQAGLAEALRSDPQRPAQTMDWGLHLTQLIEVRPGAEAQPLHSDGGYCMYDFNHGVEHALSMIWALDSNFS